MSDPLPQVRVGAQAASQVDVCVRVSTGGAAAVLSVCLSGWLETVFVRERARSRSRARVAARGGAR